MSTGNFMVSNWLILWHADSLSAGLHTDIIQHQKVEPLYFVQTSISVLPDLNETKRLIFPWQVQINQISIYKTYVYSISTKEIHLHQLKKMMISGWAVTYFKSIWQQLITFHKQEEGLAVQTSRQTADHTLLQCSDIKKINYSCKYIYTYKCLKV